MARRSTWITPGRLLLLAAGYTVLIFLLLPSLLIMPMSVGESAFLEFPPTGFTLRWYDDYLSDRDWIDPTIFSFQIAFLVAVMATTLGTMAAVALVRGRIAGRSLIYLLILSPIIAPNIVIAIAMFFFFAELHMIGNLWAFVLGHTVLALPYVVLTVSAALYRYDSDLDLAAFSMGAGRVQTFFRVTLPLTWPGVLSGAVLAFIISFDETTIAFFVSGTRDKTLPRRLFENVEETVSPTVAAVATLLTLMTVALTVLALLFRRIGEWRMASEKGPLKNN